MEQRKKLHDYSLILIFLALLDVFTFVATGIASFLDGTMQNALATVEPSILVPVKIVLGVLAVIMALATFGEAFIGFKGLKVSREPNADKGYITAAKFFLVLSAIASVSAFASFFDNKADLVDTILNFCNVVLDVVLYVLFIKCATAVRADALAEQK